MNTKSFQTVCQAFVLCLAILLPACSPASPTAMVETPTADIQPPTVEVAATSTPAATPTAGVVTRTITLADFGPQISFTLPDALAGQVEANSLPSVPVDPQGLFSAARPAMAQFRFNGYQPEQSYQLPFPLDAPLVMVFRTEEFPEFANEGGITFPNQLATLSALLQNGMDTSACTPPVQGLEKDLPFLPLLNSAQVFCAQPKVVEFPGERGLRYLSAYSQGIGPTLDGQVFYTFQGLTTDEKYYVSAIFPVHTGIFPEEASKDPFAEGEDAIETLKTLLNTQVEELNAHPAENFSPDLEELDSLIGSLQIE